MVKHVVVKVIATMMKMMKEINEKTAAIMLMMTAATMVVMRVNALMVSTRPLKLLVVKAHVSMASTQ